MMVQRYALPGCEVVSDYTFRSRTMAMVRRCFRRSVSTPLKRCVDPSTGGANGLVDVRTTDLTGGRSSEVFWR
jgi:hypothetical protein